MQYLFDFFMLAVISLLGAMSPGPDFAIVSRHALAGSRKAALLASLGVSVAILIHVAYSILGITLLIVDIPILFTLLQLCGSLYLGYLGVQLFITAKNPASSGVKPRKAFLSGFLTNLLNPKASLFILSVFSQFVFPSTPLIVEIGYGFVIALTAMAWFSTLSILITHRVFRTKFVKIQTKLMKIMGALLILLALSVIISLFL